MIRRDLRQIFNKKPAAPIRVEQRILEDKDFEKAPPLAAVLATKVKKTVHNRVEFDGKKVLGVGGAVSVDRRPRMREQLEYARNGVERELHWHEGFPVKMNVVRKPRPAASKYQAGT